jgi:hypothetical protein
MPLCSLWCCCDCFAGDCSTAGAPDSFDSGPCLLLARTTWLLATSNKLLKPLLVVLVVLLLQDLQGLHRAMLGPTLRGPSSHALCSS